MAEAEKIKVTDADVSDYFGDDSLSVQQAQKYYGEEYVNQTVLYNKVGDWLTSHATIAWFCFKNAWRYMRTQYNEYCTIDTIY